MGAGASSKDKAPPAKRRAEPVHAKQEAPEAPAPVAAPAPAGDHYRGLQDRFGNRGTLELLRSLAGSRPAGRAGGAAAVEELEEQPPPLPTPTAPPAARPPGPA